MFLNFNLYFIITCSVGEANNYSIRLGFRMAIKSFSDFPITRSSIEGYEYDSGPRIFSKLLLRNGHKARAQFYYEVDESLCPLEMVLRLRCIIILATQTSFVSPLEIYNTALFCPVRKQFT